MRHWSVYESIIHSRYVAVRLGTWQDKGRDKVDELLVKMGLSQRDCKQDYCAYPPTLCRCVQIAFTAACPLLPEASSCYICTSTLAKIPYLWTLDRDGL